MSHASGWVLSVDGGGSKTDVVASGLDGRVLAWERGQASSPQVLGAEGALLVLDALVQTVAAALARSELVMTHAYIAGLDLAEEIESLTRAARGRWWMPRGSIFENDLFALLRAGAAEPDAVAVVVGTGINAVAVRRDGVTARFPALGSLSGDWGGGVGLGAAALWHAIRGEDGRGEHTILEQLIPERLGVPNVTSVGVGIHLGRLEQRWIPRLTETLFEASQAGDAVANTIVDRQADEVVTMAVALIRRLGQLHTSIPVVLGGGVLAAGDARLLGRIRAGLADRCPGAEVRLVCQPPIVGAAMLTLEAASKAGADVEPGAVSCVSAYLVSTSPRQVVPRGAPATAIA